MVKTSVFKDLEMMMLPISNEAQIFEDKFMLTDNLNVPDGTAELEKFCSSEYPFKINFNMILFCVEGCLKVRINFREYRLQPNSVLFALPGTVGECLEYTPDYRLFLIAFSGSMDIIAANSPMALDMKRYVSNNAVVGISRKEVDECLMLYRVMNGKMQHSDFTFKKEVLNGYMQVLFAIGYQWLADNKKHTEAFCCKSRQQGLCDDFLELVRENHLKRRGISFYADRLCVSPKYLSSVVKQISGRYAGEWIKDYVIIEAKALLRSNRYTVQQISDMLNFANPSFFGKYFKAAVGCSPCKYAMGTNKNGLSRTDCRISKSE
ncbi:AraC family transcriptional regulator [Palleniella muris]|uniref:AraC family transcriptional regulator n=1 Tax=Palleniella muris TaxID=3038145 RepID=A0AC61QQT7_9BACT|nr:helix-turn-helix domain-containing protein [Palleniella muris]TGX82335.1 AraC family transcriptional regulator [Palleniella muris]